MTKKFVAGNWKMNGARESNGRLLATLAAHAVAVEVAVCVPFPYLAQTAQALTGSAVHWGAQDVSEHPPGAYTGEVSSDMLREFGCHYVIAGHSERRAYHHETDAAVARKAARALEAGMTPIVCVGETLQERDGEVTDAVVARQLRPVADLLGPHDLARVVIAYEPVWAIGSGRSATPEQVLEVHGWIRQLLNWATADEAGSIRILYGGSVKPANAAQLLSLPNVDGALVGGASLVAQDFLEICRAAA